MCSLQKERLLAEPATDSLVLTAHDFIMADKSEGHAGSFKAGSTLLTCLDCIITSRYTHLLL